jgi:murein L,D-transpeptidase YafK
MKKYLLSSLSILVYLLLGIALILYLLNRDVPKPEETIPTSQTLPSHEKPSIAKTLPPIPLAQKEKDLIHIDFDVRLDALGAKVGDPVFIRIFKEESLLEVWIKPNHEYLLFKQYPICAFSGHLGPKLKEGDKQSPEGFYKVTKHLLNPKSKFHLAFNLGYPNAYDKAHKRTGSYLMVHGACVSVGCYAMTNAKIEEIYKLVAQALKHGQKYVQVHAFPFRMTPTNMAEHEGSRWYDFWTELKEGYDYFEAEKLPPLVKVKNKHYTIHEANE